jgi:PAS domain-containing protein
MWLIGIDPFRVGLPVEAFRGRCPRLLYTSPAGINRAASLSAASKALTERRRNQEIVAAERLARSILDQAAGAILVVDPTGKIIRASRSASQLAKTALLLRQFDEVYSLRIKSDAIADEFVMGAASMAGAWR